MQKLELLELDRKRAIRKARESDPSKNVNCPVCGRACASAFGLSVHRRKKKHWSSSSITKDYNDDDDDAKIKYPLL